MSPAPCCVSASGEIAFSVDVDPAGSVRPKTSSVDPGCFGAVCSSAVSDPRVRLPVRPPPPPPGIYLTYSETLRLSYTLDLGFLGGIIPSHVRLSTTPAVRVGISFYVLALRTTPIFLSLLSSPEGPS